MAQFCRNARHCSIATHTEDIACAPLPLPPAATPMTAMQALARSFPGATSTSALLGGSTTPAHPTESVAHTPVDSKPKEAGAKFVIPKDLVGIVDQAMIERLQQKEQVSICCFILCHCDIDIIYILGVCMCGGSPSQRALERSVIMDSVATTRSSAIQRLDKVPCHWSHFRSRHNYVTIIIVTTNRSVSFVLFPPLLILTHMHARAHNSTTIFLCLDCVTHEVARTLWTWISTQQRRVHELDAVTRSVSHTYVLCLFC